LKRSDPALAETPVRPPHRVWAEIDLDRLASNYRLFRAAIPADVRVLVVVKADAYGHGAVEVARTVVHEGADMLGVGDSAEALELLRAGIRVPTLILGAIVESEVDDVVANEIRTCIHSEEHVDALEDAARRRGRRVRVHLMVDTGMGRLGVTPENVRRLARRIAASPWLLLEGICTHLSSVYGPAREDREYTDGQYRRFLDAVTGIGADLAHTPSSGPLLVHAANSGAVQGGGGPFNMVRPGNILYGLNPNEAAQHELGIRPVLSLRTQVLLVKEVPPGTPVSYGRSFVTERKTRIATLPIGYNDGFRYHLSNQAHVLIRGRSAPVIGKVTMDYTMVDVTEAPGCRAGDVATLIGEDGERRIGVHDLARTLDTIPLELTCGLGRRVQRVFLEAPRAALEQTPAPTALAEPVGQSAS